MTDLTEHVRRSLDPLNGQEYSAVYVALMAAARKLLGVGEPTTLMERLEAYFRRRMDVRVLATPEEAEWVALLVISYQLIQEHDG